jgi:protein-S-isoprenylcysteine O-methyltransferase Ste14
MLASKSLLSRLIRRGVFGQLVLVVVLFVPAGTLKFWQGWAFTIVNLLSSSVFCVYFYKHDPQLLERRLLTREKVNTQKRVMGLVKTLYVLVWTLPGFDFRFGWTNQWIGPMPLWLTLSALLLVPVCYYIFFMVMKANPFAASIIQVEAGQTIADTGPYRFIRHPLYAGSVVLWFAMPLALGSWVALPAFILLIPLFILRLLNEEKILRRDLPGYVEYCQRTHHRLIPFVW